MRLWTLHPRFLDAKGLVAVWREGLLAKAVLEGKTRGYRSHPQLIRFRACPSPILAIGQYLVYVCEEARSRGYAFDFTKTGIWQPEEVSIRVTKSQVEYEIAHLSAKLSKRSPEMLGSFQEAMRNEFRNVVSPVFEVIEGGVEPWEKIPS